MSDWLANGGRLNLLLVCVPLVPLVGAAAILAASRTRLAAAGRGMAFGVLSASIACAVLILVAHSSGAAAVAASIDWIQIPDGPAGLSFSADPASGTIALLLICAIGVSAVIVVATVEPGSKSSRVGYQCAGAALALSAAAAVVLAGDFLTLFVCWQISGLFGAACLLGRDEVGRNAATARKVLLYGFASDVPLLIGVFLIWSTFGTIDFQAVFSRIADPAALSADQTGNLATICVCVLAGVAGRCWQLPFFNLTGDVLSLRGRFGGMVQQFLVMPIGVAVVYRCLPLFLASNGRMIWIAGVGGTTAVLAGICATTRVRLNDAAFWSSIGWFGLMLVGLGAGNAAGLTGTILLFVVHQLALPMLSVRRGENRYGVRLATIAFLVCGLGGQNRILAAIAPGQASSEPFGFAAYVLIAFVGLAQLLMAFALVRAHFADSREAAEIDRGVTASQLGQWTPIVGGVAAVVFAAFTVFASPMLENVLFPAIQSTIPAAISSVELRIDWTMTAVVFLPAAIGGVIGWMSRVNGEDRSAPIGRLLGFFAGPARHGFYLEDVWDLLVIQPVRAVAQLIRLCEWFFIDRFLAGLPVRIPKLLIRCAGPLRTGTFSFYALSVLLATAVLLAVLASPGG